MAATIQALIPVLMSNDVARSIAFYRLLGFVPAFQDDDSAPRYAALVRDGIELHLQWQDAGQWAHPIDRPTYRFVVPEVDVLHAEFVRSGAMATQAAAPGPLHLPAETPWGTREFHLRDPDGNGLQFYREL
jgi:catechol 2,3-dioxygenase-like lactoylglutathione lyase family enzyme